MVDAETQAINKDNVIAGAAENAYHPSYSSTDAILVITSSDGVRFRVHSLLLGMGSEIFRDMMSQAKDTGEPIILQEKASVVKMLLDFIYPNAPYVQSNDYSFQDFWNLLIAADKYGFHRIVQEFHERTLSGSYFSDNATEAFVIGARYGWLDVLSNSTLGAIDEIASKYDELYGILTRLDSTRLLKLKRYAELRKRAVHEAVETRLKLIYADEVEYLEHAIDPEAWDVCEYPEALKAIRKVVDMKLRDRPSGLSVRETWDHYEVRRFIDENRRRLLEHAIDQALTKTLKSAEDISLGPLDKMYDG